MMCAGLLLPLSLSLPSSWADPLSLSCAYLGIVTIPARKQVWIRKRQCTQHVRPPHGPAGLALLEILPRCCSPLPPLVLPRWALCKLC